jgi:hypothetical protein
VKPFSAPEVKVLLPKARRAAIADIVKCKRKMNAGEHTTA